MSITIGSLTIVVIFSIILNILDYYDDVKTIKTNDRDDHTIIKNEFKDVESLCNSNFMQFGLYITLYAYPFLGVISIYKYDNPRFLRFWIEILNILLNLTMSLIPYYKKPFTYGEIFTEKRDIEDESLSLDNLPIRLSDILANLVYNIIASILITIVMAIFLYIINWEKLVEKSWKHRKNIIEKYVRTYMIKPFILPEYFKSLRMRLLAYYRICGEYIINKRKNQNNKKEFIKSKNSLRNSSSRLNTKLLPDNQIKDSQSSIELTEIKLEMPTSILKANNEFTNKPNIKFCRNEHFCLNTSNSNYFKKQFNKAKQINKFNENYSALKLNSSPNVKKFNKYILRRKRMIEFEIILFKKKIGGTGLNRDAYKLIKSIIAFLIVLFLYGILYTFLIIMIEDIFNTFRLYIIKIWLIPSLVQLLIVSFIINFLTNLFFSYLCFNHYEKRKNNCLTKITFKYVISKYIVNMYKIRNFVTKYYKKINKNKK